jgi:hypothetical protein
MDVFSRGVCQLPTRTEPVWCDTVLVDDSCTEHGPLAKTQASALYPMLFLRADSSH